VIDKTRMLQKCLSENKMTTCKKYIIRYREQRNVLEAEKTLDAEFTSYSESE